MVKGRSSLGAARTLFTAGFPSESTSRAYFGAFYAAEAALLVQDVTSSKHSGVISAFNRHIVKDGGLDRTFGAALRALFDARNRADDGPGEVTAEEAREFLDRAEAVLGAVAGWIADRSSE